MTTSTVGYPSESWASCQKRFASVLCFTEYAASSYLQAISKPAKCVMADFGNV